MYCERGTLEERWLREGNATRYVEGLRRVWDLPLADGSVLLLVPADLPCEEREALYESHLLQHWCRRYGLPDARVRMREFVHGADSVAD